MRLQKVLFILNINYSTIKIISSKGNKKLCFCLLEIKLILCSLMSNDNALKDKIFLSFILFLELKLLSFNFKRKGKYYTYLIKYSTINRNKLGTVFINRE